MKIPQTFLFLILSFYLSASCTTWSSRKKPFGFKSHTNSIKVHLNSILTSEEVEVDGKEINTNGKISSELVINLINPQNPPADTQQLKKTGAMIAALIKQVIKSPEDFETYSVYFTSRVENALLTKTNYIGFEYKSHEIHPNAYFTSLGDKLDSLPSRAIGKTSFTSNDSSIYSVLFGYNLQPALPLSYKIFKETQPREIFVGDDKLDVSQPGNNYFITSLNLKFFYKTKELQSGDYRVEYLVEDSVVGAQHFRLK